MDKFYLYSVDLIVQGLLCTVQGPSRHGQVQPVQLGPHCTGTPLCSTRPLQTWTSSTCIAWISLYRDPSVQYKAPPEMDKFSLYSLDLAVQGLLCTVQGPLQTWTSSTCTAWTSLYRDPSVQYKAPPDMDKFNLYSLDLVVQGPLYKVQGPSRHGQVQPVQLGPRCTGTTLYSTRASPDMDKFNLYSLDLIVQGPLCIVQGLSRHEQVQPVQLGPHCTRTPLYSTRAPPDMNKFSLYSLDLVVRGLLCTVQGPSRHGQVQPVQLGPHCTGTPLYSTRPLQTWTSSTCTGWTSLYRDSSIQYKVPPDMDKFNPYSLDLVVQGPLYTVQGHSRHGQVQPVQLGPRCTGTPL